MTATILQVLNARNYVLQLDSRVSQHGTGFYMGGRLLVVGETVIVTWREESHDYLITGVGAPGRGSVAKSIVSGDDGWWTTGGGSYDSADDNFEIGKSTVANFDSWMRFQNVQVEQGAVVSLATLVMTQKAKTAVSGNVAIFTANDVDDAVAPTTSGEGDALARTTANTQTNILGQADESEHRIDVTGAVNEVFARGGWALGNALMILTHAAVGVWEVRMYSIDNLSKEPRLELVFDDDTPTEQLSIPDLADVDLTGLADAHILLWDAAAEAWEPHALSVDATIDKDGVVTVADRHAEAHNLDSHATRDHADLNSIGTDDHADQVGQAEAEAGSATTDRMWTALRVAQAIAALGGGGGGGGSGVGGGQKHVWMPDAAPAVAGAEDDEFDGEEGGLPGGWTEFDIDAIQTVGEDEAGLTLRQPTGAGVDITGVYKTIPSGDFTIWAKLGISNVVGNAAQVGLALWEDATSATADLWVISWEHGSTQDALQVTKYSDYQTLNTQPFNEVGNKRLTHVYLRIRRGGTSYAFDWSTDGISYERVRFDAALGFVPTHFGIVVNNEGTGDDLQGRAGFFRYLASNAGHRGLAAGARVALGTLADNDQLSIRDKPTVDDPPDDEFDQGAGGLDAQWTVVEGASGVVDLTEAGNVEEYDLTSRPGTLLMQVGSIAGQAVRLRQDYTLPDDDSIILALTPTVLSDVELVNNETWVGIWLNDDDSDYNAGTYVGLFLDASVDGARWLYWDGSDIGGAGGRDPSGEVPIAGLGSRVYLRIIRVAQRYFGYISFDGQTWNPMGSTDQSVTFTNIWIQTESFATSGDPVPIQAFHWVRLGGGGIDPW